MSEPRKVAVWLPVTPDLLHDASFVDETRKAIVAETRRLLNPSDGWRGWPRFRPFRWLP